MRGSGDSRLSASFCQNGYRRPKSSILLPVSMPYQPHSEYQSPYAAPPPPVKRRPSAAWFAVGGVLLLVAIVAFGISIYHFVRTIANDDAVFSATGTHAVTLPAG